jgi:hypothetical protein
MSQFLDYKPPPFWVGGGLLGGANGVESTSAAAIPSRDSATQTGDIEILIIETNGGQPGTTATAGWSQVPFSPQDSTNSCLAVWWHRFTSGDALPTVDDSGDHQVAYMFPFRGCREEGVPWDTGAGAVDNVADTTASIPGATTTVDNCLVMAICSSGRDANATFINFDNWLNPDLAVIGGGQTNSVNARRWLSTFDRTSVAGAGGGFGFALGYKFKAGAYAATTVDLATSETKGMISLALR